MATGGSDRHVAPCTHISSPGGPLLTPFPHSHTASLLVNTMVVQDNNAPRLHNLPLQGTPGTPKHWLGAELCPTQAQQASPFFLCRSLWALEHKAVPPEIQGEQLSQLLETTSSVVPQGCPGADPDVLTCCSLPSPPHKSSDTYWYPVLWSWTE